MEKQEWSGDNTPYDDVFRTLVTKGGNMVIPLINEMFPSDHPISLDAPVVSLSNEWFEDEGNGKQKKLVTDSHLRIEGKTYHLECQSQDDDSILIRMFRYDSRIALLEAAREARFENYHLTIRMPQSGVLFLRKTAKTPRAMTVTLETPGGSIDYQVPAARLADYPLDALMEKGLLFLLPFYLFNLEKNFPSVEKGKQSFRDTIEPSAVQLVEYLNGLYQDGKINLYRYDLLVDMFRKVSDNLTRKYAHLRKELDAVMGGKILEFKGEKEWNAGEAKGRQEGRAEGRKEGRKEGRQEGRAEGKVLALADMVRHGFLTPTQAEETAKKLYGTSSDDFRKFLHESDTEERMQG